MIDEKSIIPKSADDSTYVQMIYKAYHSDLTGNWPKLSTVLAGVAAVAATVAVARRLWLPVELQFRQLLLVEVLRLDYLLDRPLLPLQRPHWLWLGRQQLQVQPVMP